MRTAKSEKTKWPARYGLLVWAILANLSPIRRDDELLVACWWSGEALWCWEGRIATDSWMWHHFHLQIDMGKSRRRETGQQVEGQWNGGLRRLHECQKWYTLIRCKLTWFPEATSSCTFWLLDYPQLVCDKSTLGNYTRWNGKTRCIRVASHFELSRLHFQSDFGW